MKTSQILVVRINPAYELHAQFEGA